MFTVCLLWKFQILHPWHHSTSSCCLALLPECMRRCYVAANRPSLHQQFGHCAQDVFTGLLVPHTLPIPVCCNQRLCPCVVPDSYVVQKFSPRVYWFFEFKCGLWILSHLPNFISKWQLPCCCHHFNNRDYCNFISHQETFTFVYIVAASVFYNHWTAYIFLIALVL